MTLTAASFVVPVGSHLFAPDALQKVLDETLPLLPPGKTIALAGTVDVKGVKVAVIFQSVDQHWQAKAAFAHDWTGQTTVGGTITFIG